MKWYIVDGYDHSMVELNEEQFREWTVGCEEVKNDCGSVWVAEEYIVIEVS